MSRNADAYAKQMQNAECRMQNAEYRMQMQNALQMQIALQVRYQKNTPVRSQTACAPEALGQIFVLRPLPPTPACMRQGLRYEKCSNV